jgi:hypothetical protein
MSGTNAAVADALRVLPAVAALNDASFSMTCA